MLSLIDASTTKSYTYVDLATAIEAGDEGYAGWWDAELLAEGDLVGGRANDVVFKAGQGLLCNIASSGVLFTYAGEVVQGAASVPLLGRFAMLSNFLPVDITLGDIEAIGMDSASDIVQLLNLTDASATKLYTYVDVATAIEAGDKGYAGWWDAELLAEGDLVNGRADNVVIPAGAGLLCNITSPNVSFVFPDVVPAN